MNAFKLPLNLQGNMEIRMIGDRGAGKTTFLAALVYCWKRTDYYDGPILSVEAFGQASQKLIDKAQDFLEDGRPTPASDLYDSENPDRLPPLYNFYVNLKAKLFAHPLAWILKKPIKLTVACREYPGELFSELRELLAPQKPILNQYLDDCAKASGLMLLIDGTSRLDKDYAETLKILLKELNLRWANNRNNMKLTRIAVVFSKGEQDDVWVRRDNLVTFTDLNFPKTKAILQDWCQSKNCAINYFTCSAFGMMNDPPEANVREVKSDRGGTYGVINRKDFWKPFGLVAPIYWLHTGKDNRQLREI
ncbi:hypothetical protein ACE1CD_06500 [Aerosakkonema sp. BLCC-F183]|uniref:hypothetical protein n=1 Tax=Aerosakkonema sp. BLCC-F183 TaxID=3342834 RepID=UPI0035B9913D